MNILIMAGGQGERFWPKSRTNKPKQLLPIVSNKTMIEETVERLQGLVLPNKIFISTNLNLVEEIKELLPYIPEENYIIEPLGRDTAAAIGLGAVYISKRDPGSVMTVLPADHYILEPDIFQEDLKIAEKIAKDTGCLITFGITPSRIETGYGFIELGEIINTSYENHAYEVKNFKEKPDLLTAKDYFQKKNFLWNSGIFIWTTNEILNAIENYLPDLYNGLMDIQDAIDTTDEIAVLQKNFEQFVKISIDYGVMEKADNVLCIKAKFTWDDVGSWSALERVNKKDENNNIIRSSWKGVDTKNCIIINDDGLIATIGLNNLVIIKEKNALLIAEKTQEQEIKKIVTELKQDENLKDYTN